MKHIPFASLLLASAAFGGTEVAPAPMPPAAEPSLWGWFVGGSVGYLVDSEEWMYTAHVGAEMRTGSGLSHAFYLEGGYAEWDERASFDLPPANWDNDPRDVETDAVLDLSAELEIIPVTFNYKLEGAFTDTFKWYVGAGVGAAFIDVDVDASVRGTGTDPDTLYDRGNFSDDDTVFAAQVFAGVIWEVSESFELFGGARYIYIDDPNLDDLFGETPGVELDDVMIEGGMRFTF